MTDTKRTSSTLLTTLFQDGQADGAITPQDMRDFIVSMVQPHGAAYMAANATATTITTANTFYTIAGTWTTGGHAAEMTEGTAGGTLTYTGAPTRHMHVVANVSFTCDQNNQVISFHWELDGTPISAPTDRKIGTGTDIGSVSVHADTPVATGEVLQLKVTNETSSGATVTVRDAYVFAVGMFG